MVVVRSINCSIDRLINGRKRCCLKSEAARVYLFKYIYIYNVTRFDSYTLMFPCTQSPGTNTYYFVLGVLPFDLSFTTTTTRMTVNQIQIERIIRSVNTTVHTGTVRYECEGGAGSGSGWGLDRMNNIV